MIERLGRWVSTHKRLITVVGIALLVTGYAGWRWASGFDRRLYGLDVATGRVLWSTVLPAQRSPLIPAAANQRVFATYITSSQENTNGDYDITEIGLSAFDGETGRSLWESKLDVKALGKFSSLNWRASSLYAGGDNIYLVLNAGENSGAIVIAFDGTKGTQLWKHERLETDVSTYFVAPPLLQVGNRLLALFQKETSVQLLMIDPQTGQEMQTLQSWTDFRAPYTYGVYLCANTQTVYVQSFVNEKYSLLAVDAATGKTRFKIPQLSGFRLGCDSINVYAMQSATVVAAYDALTGESRWTFDLYTTTFKQIRFLTGIVGGNDTLLIQAYGDGDIGRSEEVSLLALNARDGQIRWTRPYANFIGDYFYRPTITGSTVLMLGGKDGNGGVLALSLTDGSEQWHMITSAINTDGQSYSPLMQAPVSDGARAFAISYVTGIGAR